MESGEREQRQDDECIERNLDAIRRRHQQCIAVVELDRECNRSRRNREKQKPEQDAHRLAQRFVAGELHHAYRFEATAKVR